MSHENKHGTGLEKLLADYSQRRRRPDFPYWLDIQNSPRYPENPLYNPQNIAGATMLLTPIYKSEEMLFQNGNINAIHRISALSQYNNVLVSYPFLADGIYDVYEGIRRAKDARGVLVKDDDHNMYAMKALRTFAPVLSEDPGSIFLLGDIIAAKLKTPGDKDPMRIRTVIEDLRKELGTFEGKIITAMLLGNIINRQVTMQPII